MASLPEVVYRGGSSVIDPFGHPVPGAEPLWDTDGILYATLDMQQVPASKWEFDPMGHYARPDAVHLEVNDIEREARALLGMWALLGRRNGIPLPVNSIPPSTADLLAANYCGAPHYPR